MPKKLPAVVRDRAVRMAVDWLSGYPSVYAACKAVAPKRDVGSETLRSAGQKDGPTTDELEELKRLRAEGDLRDVNEILNAASIFFAREFDPRRR